MTGSAKGDDVERQEAVAVPRVLAGYELIERLGSSRTAGTFTFRARQTSLGRTVRMVLLPPRSVARPHLRAGFERQVAVASRLRHDNLICAIDAGAAAGCLYVVFEDLHGRTVAQAVESGAPLPPERVLEIGRDVGGALDHLASQGLVHRNVVPSSVFLPDHGPAKLAGLAAAKVRQSDAAETWFDHKPDTAPFVAPEAVKGIRGIDIRADIYSLGCVLYLAATGRPAFAGGTAATILERHLKETPADPRTHVPGLPEGLVRVLDRCLRRERTLRYAKPADLVADVELARAGKPVGRGPGMPLWRDRPSGGFPSLLRRPR